MTVLLAKPSHGCDVLESAVHVGILPPEAQSIVDYLKQREDCDLSSLRLFSQKIFGIEGVLSERFGLELSDSTFNLIKIASDTSDVTPESIAFWFRNTVHSWINNAACLRERKIDIVGNVCGDLFRNLSGILLIWKGWQSAEFAPHGSEVYVYHRSGRIGLSWYVVKR